jgi:hypothetical protein
MYRFLALTSAILFFASGTIGLLPREGIAQGADTTCSAAPASSGKTGLRLRVQEFPLFPAPRKPLDIWALNVCYTIPSGQDMLMSRIQVDYRGQNDWQKAIDYNQRLISRDNGRTWVEQGPVVENGSCSAQTAWMHFLDPDNGSLLGVFCRRATSGEKLYKLYYEISKDAGKTWSPARQIIGKGKDCDATRWMPGIDANVQEVAADQASFVKVADGAIVCGFELTNRRDKARQGVVFLRAVWNQKQDDLDWDISQIIIGPAGARPLCEPDLIHLGGQRLLTTMRCEGDQKKGIPSSRQCAVSEDGGRTWSKTWPMKYDDGSSVFVPASISAFERDPSTGKVYWFANILDKPVYGQSPRSPLCIAEFDTKQLCLIRSTVTPIIPPCTPKPPYSNFGHYRDRQTGEFVLIPAEQIPYQINPQTDPFFAYRVRMLPE